MYFIKYVESVNGWNLSFTVKVTSKFKGQHIELIPEGAITLKFIDQDQVYSWTRAKAVANNVIFGKMWINVAGEIDIINQKTNDTCHVNFFPYSALSRVPVNKVSAIVKDDSNKGKFYLDGSWTSEIACQNILNESYVFSFDKHEKFVFGPAEVLWKRNLSE